MTVQMPAATRVCTRDGAELTARKHLGIEFQACGQCGGLWFARDDLQRLELRAPKGSRPPSASATGPPPSPSPSAAGARCLCPGRPVMKPVGRRGVTLDVCPACDGVWLDAGEIERILQCYDGFSRPEVDQADDGEAPALASAVGTSWDLAAGVHLVGVAAEAIGCVFDFLSSPG